MRFDPKKKRTHKSWKPKPIEVSIITVNYNGFDDTCQMIESIRRHIRSVVYEIIVVDNASRKNEAFLLRKRYPFIQVVRSSINRGFAGGNNLGVNVANGKYLFFLNNDTFVKEDKFRELLNRFDSDKKIGAVCPMIRYTDENELIQFAGFTQLSRYTLRNKSIGNGAFLDEQYLSAKEIPYLHGAAMLVKREIYSRVGLMPEMYFLYYEELDWSLTIRYYGYKLWYDPCCMIYHKESRSTGVNSPLKVFYLTRNRFLYSYRNRSSTEKIICHTYLLLCVVPRDCLRYLFQLKFDLIWTTLKGVLAYYVLTKKQKLENNGFKYSFFLY